MSKIIKILQSKNKFSELLLPWLLNFVTNILDESTKDRASVSITVLSFLLYPSLSYSNEFTGSV